jgi:hypothetical protein
MDSRRDALAEYGDSAIAGLGCPRLVADGATPGLGDMVVYLVELQAADQKFAFVHHLRRQAVVQFMSMARQLARKVRNRVLRGCGLWLLFPPQPAIVQKARATNSAHTFALSEIASRHQILTAIEVTHDVGIIGTGFDLINF